MHSWSFKFVFGHRREREKKWYILILLIFSNCYSICFLGVSFSSISIIFHSFWRRHYCRWRAALFYPCSALMANEQWGSLVCHTYCDTGHPFNGHLRGPVTLTLNAEPFVSGTVTTCFYDLGLSWLGFQHPTILLRGELSNPLHHRRAACMYFWNNS